MRERMWLVLMMMALCAVVAFAADVTGKWTAQLPPPRGGGAGMELTFNFKVDGETLTGTFTGPLGPAEIKEGKVSGDDISFVITGPTGPRAGEGIRYTFKGKVKGDEIEFTTLVEHAVFMNFTAKKVE